MRVFQQLLQMVSTRIFIPPHYYYVRMLFLSRNIVNRKNNTSFKSDLRTLKTCARDIFHPGRYNLSPLSFSFLQELLLLTVWYFCSSLSYITYLCRDTTILCRARTSKQPTNNIEIIARCLFCRLR